MTGLTPRPFLKAALFAVSSLCGVMPVSAQEASTGRLATSSAGQVGQRQVQSQMAPGIKPMARLNNRIQNRVQSRIRSRIDRDYSPPADTLSSFTAAAAQARVATQSGGR
jgi:hypothetical protein